MKKLLFFTAFSFFISNAGFANTISAEGIEQQWQDNKPKKSKKKSKSSSSGKSQKKLKSTKGKPHKDPAYR